MKDARLTVLADLVGRSLHRQVPELDPRVFVEAERIVIRIAAESVEGKKGRRFPVLFRIEKSGETWRILSELGESASSHGLLNKVKRLVES